jgi:hypothetical protein
MVPASSSPNKPSITGMAREDGCEKALVGLNRTVHGRPAMVSSRETSNLSPKPDAGGVSDWNKRWSASTLPS